MFDPSTDDLVARARRNTLGEAVRRTARRFPDRVALRCGDAAFTYAQLDERIDAAALALSERGVSRGDRVAIVARNSDDYVVAFLALVRLGAIAVTVNFMLGAGEIAYILAHSGSTAVITEPDLRETVEQAIDDCEPAQAFAPRVLVGGAAQPPPGWESLHGWLAGPGTPPPAVPVRDDDPIQIMYTSGTESRPKGATMSSAALMSQYVSCTVDGEMSADDVELHAMPLFHCAQMHCFMMTGLFLGARNIILRGPDPALLLESIEVHQATKLFAPPTVWIAMLRHGDFDRRDLSSLRKAYYGASIMPVEIVRELAARLPGVRLFNFYGQTEMAPLATVLSPADQLRKPGSAGRAALNVETRVVDAAGEPAAPGEVGEIVHRSPHAMLGYWNDPGTTALAFAGGWFHSGDLGTMDEDGYLTVVDRIKDMIKTGGENVASREVEEVLYQHPAVAEVAVLGVPHPTWIESVTAIVVTRPASEVGADELITFCRDRLAGFKTPKTIVFADALPKNASGKILKRELRGQLGAGAE